MRYRVNYSLHVCTLDAVGGSGIKFFFIPLPPRRSHRQSRSRFRVFITFRSMRDTNKFHFFFHIWKLLFIQNYRFLYHGDQKISWWRICRWRAVNFEIHLCSSGLHLAIDQHPVCPKLAPAWTQLIYLSNKWQMALEKGNHVQTAFLDLSKAYDRVSIPGLLFKLSALGFSTKSLKWFSSFLQDRTQCVRVKLMEVYHPLSTWSLESRKALYWVRSCS